jgi:hypothetical protein
MWAVVGGFLGSGILITLLTIGYLTRSSAGAAIAVEPKLTVLYAPSPTPPEETRQASTQLPAPTPSLTYPPLPEGEFQFGELVAVSGTGGDGLRLRNEPGLLSVISSLALENEVFEVRGGPTAKDGYSWWYLVNPYDTDAAGWAAANYLRSIGSP